MKSNAINEYLFTCDYYGYKLITSADGTVTTREYDLVSTPVKISVSVIQNNQLGTVGDLSITSQSKMQLNGYLRNLVDRNGNEIYQGGEWMIIQTSPIINSLGFKDGYRYQAHMFAGNI